VALTEPVGPDPGHIPVSFSAGVALDEPGVGPVEAALAAQAGNHAALDRSRRVVEGLVHRGGHAPT